MSCAELLPSSQPFHINTLFLQTHTHTQWLIFCLVLYASLGFSAFLFFFCKSAMGFLAVLMFLCHACKCGQAQTQLSGTEVIFCRISTKQDLPVTNVLQLTYFWVGVWGVYGMWKKWVLGCFFILNVCTDVCVYNLLGLLGVPICGPVCLHDIAPGYVWLVHHWSTVNVHSHATVLMDYKEMDQYYSTKNLSEPLKTSNSLTER